MQHLIYSVEKNNNIWVEDSANNGIYINFKGNSAVFNNKTNSFVLPKDKIKVDYDEDYIDEKLRDMYKNLHYTYAEIALNYGNRIHYNLA